MGYVSVGPKYNGQEAYAAEIPAKWYKLFKRYMAKYHPDISVILVQALGGAKASAGTHSDGWAFDFQNWHLTSRQNEILVAESRRFGGVAWARYRSQGFEPHDHVACDSGGSSDTACQYQVVAAHAGYNGLGYRGRKGGDNHPAPAKWVTCAQGIGMMEAILGGFKSNEEGPTLDKSELIQAVREGVGGLNWGNETFGAYLGRMQAACQTAAYYAHQAATQTAPITRPGDPSADSRGQVVIRQEIADAKTRITAVQAQMEELRNSISVLADLVRGLAPRDPGVTA